MQNQIVVEQPMKQPSTDAINAYESVKEVKKQIRTLQKEMREEMLKNPDYAQCKEEALDANRELNFEKNKLLKTHEFVKRQEKIDSLKETLKVRQLTLFTELDKYTQETGIYVLPLDEGRKVIEREYKLKKD